MTEPGADWMEGLDEAAVEVHQAEVVVAEEKGFVRDLQATIFQSASGVIEDAMLWAHIRPKQEGPTPEWIKKYGLDEANRKFLVAKTAWMNSKDAPVGLQLAQRVMIGITKAKAMEEAAPRSLSVTLIQGTPPAQYPEKMIDASPKNRF